MHPKTTARRAALRALVAIDAGRILTLSFEEAPPETRAFGREIFSGSLRWRGRLDWTLKPLLKQPLRKLDPPVRAALRLAAYERYYLQTPLSALANEYAGLMRGEKLGSATAFVNAVLRRLPEELRPPPPEKDAVAHLAVLYSHPEWLVERYLKRFGFEECRQLLEANNQQARLSLRTNTLKTNRESLLHQLRERGVEAIPGELSPDAIIVEQGGDPTSWPEWPEGLLIAQDEAAQLVARYAAPTPGSTVVDLAAAPGGKTTHLGQLMENRGRILAYDVAPGRLKLIEENASRLGIGIIETRAGDAREIAPGLAQELKAGAPSVVLLDAPCSGTGTLRRRPDARWRRTPDQLREMVQLQRELLDSAANLVSPGGVLVYSTCSIEPEENEVQVLGWLERHPEWNLDPAARSEFGIAVNDGGWLATLPHRHGTDGMFAARLVRDR